MILCSLVLFHRKVKSQEGPNSKGELDYIGLDDEDVETIKQSLAPVYADDRVVYMVSVDDDY